MIYIFARFCLIFALAEAFLRKAILDGANKETLSFLLNNRTKKDINEKSNSGLTLFHVAVAADNYDACELLIEKGVKLDAEDETHASALFYATAANNVRMVNFLVGKGAQVDHKDKKGRRALHVAAKHGFVEVFTALLLNGSRDKLVGSEFERWSPEFNGWSSYHYAARWGRAKIIDVMSFTEKPKNEPDVEKLTPFLLAIVNNHEEAAFVLMNLISDDLKKYGSSREIGYASRYGRKAVLLALIHLNDENGKGNAWLNAIDFPAMDEMDEYAFACDRSAEMVKALILAGVDLRAVNDFGENAIDISMRRGNHAVYSLISKETKIRSSRALAEQLLPRLHADIMETNPNVERIRELIDAIPAGNIDERDYLNRTAIHLAVEMDNFEIAKALISRKCNLALRDVRGSTVMHLAKSADVARLLLQADPNLINIADVEGNLPLQAAVYEDREDVVSVLAPVTMDKNHFNCRRFRALEMTSLTNNLNIAECLLQHGAGENLQRGYHSPLHFSAMNGRVELTHLFLDYGLETVFPYEGGLFPVHNAIRLGENMDLIRVLMRDVPPDVTDMLGYSLMHYAVISGENRGKVIKLLWGEFRVPLDTKALRGRTPLYVAARRCSVENVRTLIECGSDVMLTTPSGKTALHVAMWFVKDTSLECISSLAHADRNILNVKNSKGWSPVGVHVKYPGTLRRKVIAALELTPDDVSVNMSDSFYKRGIRIILTDQSPSFAFFLAELYYPVTFREYVEQAMKDFIKDCKLEKNSYDFKGFMSNGFGIFYSFSAAYYPYVALDMEFEDITKTGTEPNNIQMENIRNEIKIFETSHHKDFYMNKLRFMLVESFLNEEGYKRFIGTYMENFPKELIEDVLVGVTNNGNFLGRMEMTANCLMLTLKSIDEFDVYYDYLWGKMARLSEAIIQK